MLGRVPYILVIGHVLTVAVIGLVWKLVGGIQKHRLFSVLQTLPSLFPFALNLVLIQRPEGTRK